MHGVVARESCTAVKRRSKVYVYRSRKEHVCKREVREASFRIWPALCVGKDKRMKRSKGLWTACASSIQGRFHELWMGR